MPVALTASQLAALSELLGMRIYWVGPQAGYRYEFSRTFAGHVYVRYLPGGTRDGEPGRRFRIVATYPFGGPRAFRFLKRVARGKAMHGPRGSIYLILAHDRAVPHGHHVIAAFPRGDYQIEVYDPHSGASAAFTSSGRIRPVAP